MVEQGIVMLDDSDENLHGVTGDLVYVEEDYVDYSGEGDNGNDMNGNTGVEDFDGPDILGVGGAWGYGKDEAGNITEDDNVGDAVTEDEDVDVTEDEDVDVTEDDGGDDGDGKDNVEPENVVYGADADEDIENDGDDFDYNRDPFFDNFTDDDDDDDDDDDNYDNYDNYDDDNDYEQTEGVPVEDVESQGDTDSDDTELLEERGENLRDVTNSELELSNFLNLDRDAYSIEVGTVLFKEVRCSREKANSRVESEKGLTKSIQESGILTPIHVMISKQYGEWLQGDRKEQYTGHKYELIDGFRRVITGVRLGLNGCHAVIWNFNDKDLGRRYLLPLGTMLNHTQKYTWRELWGVFNVLDSLNPLPARCMEWLLQLQRGDLPKFQDIMTCEYPEVQEALLTNKKTLSQVHAMLKKLWDEGDQSDLDDNMAISDINKKMKNEDGIGKANRRVIGDGEEYIGEDGEVVPPRKEPLSDSEIKSILGLSDKFDEADDEEMLDACQEIIKEPAPKRQDPKNRKQLDPALKRATLQRDGYKCVCCGAGGNLPINFANSILQSHHVISVANGGPDSEDNIITVCQNCHTMIHTMLWRQGLFTKKDFAELPDSEREYMRKRLKYATMDYQAAKKRGKTQQDISEQNKNHSKFKYPGTDLDENTEALRGVDLEVESEKYRSEAPSGSRESIEDIEDSVNS